MAPGRLGHASTINGARTAHGEAARLSWSAPPKSAPEVAVHVGDDGQLESLAAAGRELTDAESLDEALAVLGPRRGRGDRRDACRRPGPGQVRRPALARRLVGIAPALGAELEGSRLLLEELGTAERSEADGLPAASAPR